MNKTYSLGLYEKAMPGGMSFEAMLESTQKSGFDFLEISIDESDERLSRLEWNQHKRTALLDITRNIGVPIKTICLSGHRRFPFGSHDAAKRQRARDMIEKAVEFAADIGVRVIQLAGYDVYYEKSDEVTRAYFLENLIKGTEYAAAAGVNLGFETMETPFMDTVEKAMKFVNEVNSPYLGVYPDIGNLTNASVLYGKSILEDIHCGAGKIFAAHLKETVPGVYRNRRFGEGHTDYISCIRELYAQGVRIFAGEFWYLGEENYMDTLCQSSSFLRNRLKLAIGGKASE